ncbi:MAG: hypothetical protein SAJ37_20640 [Oscillatoria sp. PMC 1068.18]|nr:hypothetical protein [Oscillatoria sp. PMC 1076.18]MEC4991149.1 hypothetical protein [Oscillatoria sp. PMC 1068.18]
MLIKILTPERATGDRVLLLYSYQHLWQFMLVYGELLIAYGSIKTFDRKRTY